MAVLFMDGFDHYASRALGDVTNEEMELNGWTEASYYWNGTDPSDRFTNYNGRMISGGAGATTAFKSGLPSTANCTLGFAMKETAGWNQHLCSVWTGVNKQVHIHVDNSGYISIYNTPFQVVTPFDGLQATSINSLNLSTWYYFEIVVTAATVNVLVDGVSWVTTSGQSYNLIDGFMVEAAQGGYLDDLYFLNTTTPLDAPRIITLYPNEGGTETGWKETWREVEASGGYDLSIDEEYISSFTSGQKESWKYNELPPGNWDVHAVGPVFRAKNNGAGTPTITITCSTGAETTGIQPSNTFTHTKHVENFSDAGGLTAWTKSAVNGLEMIVEYD